MHVQNTLLSLHSSAGPYKPGDVFPTGRIKKTLSGFTTQLPAWQRCNSDQLNLPVKIQGEMVTPNKTDAFAPRERRTQVMSPNATSERPFIL